MKVGQQVVAYRGGFKELGVGIITKSLRKCKAMQVKFINGVEYFVRKSSLRYARISDVSVVCRVKRTKDNPFGFAFDDGQIIVRYCDNFHDDKGIQNWKGEDIYLFQDNNGYTQWVHPSQVEIV